MIETLLLVYGGVLVPVLWSLPGALLLYLVLRAVARRIRSPLAETALDCLIAESLAAEPGLRKTQTLAALRGDPNLVARSIEAFARRHPEAPSFQGSWKYRLALRRRLEALDLEARAAERPGAPRAEQPVPVSGMSLIGGIMALLVGLPGVVMAGPFALEMLTSPSDRSTEVFTTVLGGIGALFAVMGAACCAGGIWMLRRYVRARRAASL